MTSSLSSIIISCLFLWHARGHVRLTFPPARTYALDFLNNMHSGPPCGFPHYKDASRTTLVAGTRLRVTWHLGYPHKGGVRIEIIKDDPFQILCLLTEEQYVFQNDSTRQHADVILPLHSACDNCVIRLLRQASEWGSDYLFWSCADVTIISHLEASSAAPETSASERIKETTNNQTFVTQQSNIESTSDSSRGDSFNELKVIQPPPYAPQSPLQYTSCFKGKCLNGGICNKTTGNCTCQRLFSGARCEKQDQCWENSDCNYGKCIDTRSTTHPKLVCYCESGWYGDACDIKSSVKLQTNYSSNPTYFTRVIRPDLYTIHWKFVDDEVEIVIEARTLSWVGIGWKPTDMSYTCKEFPNHLSRIGKKKFRKHDKIFKASSSSQRFTSDPEIAAEEVTEREIKSRCDNRVVGDSKLRNVTVMSSTTSNHKVVVKTKTVALHPMDCTDIVIGSVKGNLHRVQDMYTRDRSTPRPDSFYMGTDDITGAAGSQVDGVTTIVFRKKIHATHPSDHSIRPHEMMLIWAMGQNVDDYTHSPESGLEACTASDFRFYNYDELKYHGTSEARRGTLKFDFHERTARQECNSQAGSIVEPPFCNTGSVGFSCKFYMKWDYDRSRDTIQFLFRFNLKRDQFLGLAFSSDKTLGGSDAIVAHRKKGDPVVDDVSHENVKPVMSMTQCSTTELAGTFCTEQICIRLCGEFTEASSYTFKEVLILKDKVYTISYRNPYSAQYINLEQKLETSLQKIYYGLPIHYLGRVKIRVTSFEPGSIKVNYDIQVTHNQDFNGTKYGFQVHLQTEFKEYVAERKGQLSEDLLNVIIPKKYELSDDEQAELHWYSIRWLIGILFVGMAILLIVSLRAFQSIKQSRCQTDKTMERLLKEKNDILFQDVSLKALHTQILHDNVSKTGERISNFARRAQKMRLEGHSSLREMLTRKKEQPQDMLSEKIEKKEMSLEKEKNEAKDLQRKRNAKNDGREKATLDTHNNLEPYDQSEYEYYYSNVAAINDAIDK